MNFNSSESEEVFVVARYNDMVFEEYQVSNFGRVVSLKSGKPKLMKLCPATQGYLMTAFHKDRKQYTINVHRLVLFSFQEIPENYQELDVNHKNECVIDNRLSNLEWLSRKENVNYGTRNERHAKKMTNGKTSKKVFQFTLAGEFVKEWASLHEIKRQLGFTCQNISNCCLGKQKTANGYRWSYQPTLEN